MKLKRWMSLVLAALLLAGLWMGTAGAEGADKHTLAYFGDKCIGIETGTVFDNYMHTMDVFKGSQISYFNGKSDEVEALRLGKVDAVMLDKPVAIMQANENPNLYVVDEVVSDDFYGFCMKKGCALQEPLNAALAELKADGTYDALLDKWLGADASVKHLIEQDWVGENGTIVYAASFETDPMTYMGDNGEHCGFSADLMLHMSRLCGYNVEFVSLNTAAMVMAAATGKVDVAGDCLSITEERKEQVDFTDPIYNSAVVLLARDPDYQAESTGSIFQKIAASFRKTFVQEARWKLFAQGTGNTLIITLAAILGGTLLGFWLYIFYRGGNRLAKLLCRFLSWLFNGIPTVVLLMVLYYIIFGKSGLAGIWVASIAFMCLFSISFFDMLTQAVSTLDKSQTEGAIALGYSPRKTFQKIILPQALPRLLPGYKTSVKSILKGTAVVGYITVQDLTRMSDLVRGRTFEAVFPLIFVAILYFLMEGLSDLVLSRLEKKVALKNNNKFGNMLAKVNIHD